jgi:hypothetical protein
MTLRQQFRQGILDLHAAGYLPEVLTQKQTALRERFVSQDQVIEELNA